MKIIACAAVALSMATFAANGAHAAVEITMELTEVADNKTAIDTMLISPDGIKVAVGHHDMIFRPAQNSIVMLDAQKHSYIDFGDIAKRMEAMQAKLPEAQRKMMQGMMAKQSAPPTFTHTGSKTINGWACESYHVSGDMIQSDECIAKPKDVGVTDADLAVFKGFSQSMRNVIPPGMQTRADAMDFDTIDKAIGYPGIPVETVTLLDGKQKSRAVLKSVAHDPLPAGTFDIPASYTQQNMGSMGAGGADD